MHGISHHEHYRIPAKSLWFFSTSGEDDLKISFGQIRRFSWREIQLATDNFNEGNIIGQGGFGRVYKGVLSDNTKVAVKRLADYYSPGGEAAFQREVQLISVAVHKNLLRLIGFCTTSSERILVYPFMQNLSVAYQLRGTCTPPPCIAFWCIAMQAYLLYSEIFSRFKTWRQGLGLAGAETYSFRSSPRFGVSTWVLQS